MTDAPSLRAAPFPNASSYTPRSEHESATPSTFFGDKEVLYAELGSCDIYVYRQDVETDETWRVFLGQDTDEAGQAPSSEPDAARDFDETQWHLRRGVHGFVGSG